MGTKLTAAEKQHRELQKRLYGEIKYTKKPLMGAITRRHHEAVVETMDGKRRLVLLIEFPCNMAALTFGRRVFVKGPDNVFKQVCTEAFYSLPAGVTKEAE